MEIYDSADKSWRIAGHLPRDVQVPEIRSLKGKGTRIEMVFCDNSFYCLADFNGVSGVLGFSLRDGASDFVPLPNMANKRSTRPYLLACRSRVLVTVGIIEKEEREELLHEMNIWELENVNSSSSSCSSASGWKEIASMPPSLCKGVNRIHSFKDRPFNYCIGVGNYACFIFLGHVQELEVVVYSVREKRWSSLPSCSFDADKAYMRGLSVMAFEPRPGMKVT